MKLSRAEVTEWRDRMFDELVADDGWWYQSRTGNFSWNAAPIYIAEQYGLTVSQVNQIVNEAFKRRLRAAKKKS